MTDTPQGVQNPAYRPTVILKVYAQKVHTLFILTDGSLFYIATEQLNCKIIANKFALFHSLALI